MVRFLAERLRAHGQQKVRLAEREAKLENTERKARALRLIEARPPPRALLCLRCNQRRTERHTGDDPGPQAV